MHLSTPAFEDGQHLNPQIAGPGECGGKNISPAVSWSGLPDGTKSVVVTLQDPNGPKGTAVTHWNAYDIPASVTSLAAGAGNMTAENVTVGKNFSGAAAYRGPCPPVGDTPHHYVLTVTATDLAPGALPAGLDTSALDAALNGHTLRGTSIVGIYGR